MSDEKKETNHTGADAANSTLQDSKIEDDQLDQSTAKFLNGGGKGDAHVEIMDPKPDAEFRGLTKEELQAFAKDPFWIRVRWILLILFWVIWVGMLVAAIIIIVLAPRCPPRPDLKWWQKSHMYQVYPRSFKDSDGNGVGDIKGIEDKLEHFVNLNVTAIYLNPVYPSPGKDFGYDVSDYKNIDSLFGTLEDFESMLRAMHRRGLKLIMDFIPNHSSSEHPWFVESRKSKDNEYKDYYIWHDGRKDPAGNPLPPNNWLSVFGGSAWEFDTTRKQYYYHAFLKDQPDLNLRNPKVVEEIKDIMKFWLEKGVNGFRIDAVSHLIEGNVTTDEPPSNTPGLDPNDYDSLNHTQTKDQPETFALVTELRSLMNQYSESDDRKYEYRVLLTEAYDMCPTVTANYFEYNGKKGADMPLNFNLLGLNAECGGFCVQGLVDGWMDKLPSGKWANWLLGNHDNPRVASRIGEDKVNAANMLSLLLPGTSIGYYGEEIGMVNVDISFAETKDPAGILAGAGKYKDKSRDPERTPMQWDGSKFAGFTSGNKTWLPVALDYKTRNVQIQGGLGAGHTPIEVYQELTALRQEPSFQWGTFTNIFVNSNMYSFVRQAEGFKGYLVAINFGKTDQYANFHQHNKEMVPAEGHIVANTDNNGLPDFKIDTENMVSLDNIVLKPGAGVVFSLPAKSM